MKKIIFVLCACFSGSIFSGNADLLNMGYVEVNSNSLANVGCYVRSDTNKPLFQMAAIFAANINGKNPNEPEVYFNPQVDSLLNHSDQVAKLQKQGIKVLLSILGNHQNAGWACMTDAAAIQQFANQMVNIINKYHLDGIDIDDEYSTCSPNSTSMIKIARALKANPGFKGKLLTKVLFNDYSYFIATDEGQQLADFIDYGWEMTYWSSNFNRRLGPYLQYGMLKNNLGLGVDSANVLPGPAAKFVLQNGYKGMMVYGITNNVQDYLTPLAQVEYGGKVNILPNCLQ